MDYIEFIKKIKNLECGYKVTNDVYNIFQTCFKDMNPLHTDTDFAQRKGFSERVMYGNILNGFISHFVGMALPSPDVMIQTQDIQFRKPVYLNDDILLKSEIQDLSEAVEIVNLKLKFYRTNTDKPQLVATGHVQIGILHDKA